MVFYLKARKVVIKNTPMASEQLLFLPPESKFLWERCSLLVGNPELASISLLTFSEYFHQTTTPKAKNKKQRTMNNEQKCPPGNLSKT
jgi:hypothetical protein